jgi:hypothetical protein
MSEDEQEVLERLVESNDLEIHIVNWGIVKEFKAVSFGDLRLQITFRIILTAPELHIPVNHFDLELRTRTGILLFKETKPLVGPGEAIMLGAGSDLTLEWIIAIRKMDPDFVKAMKPGAIGLTSREGNYRLPEKEMALLHKMRQKEEQVKAGDRKIAKTLVGNDER